MGAQLDVSGNLAADVNTNRDLPHLHNHSRRRAEEAPMGHEPLGIRVDLDGDILGTKQRINAAARCAYGLTAANRGTAGRR